MTIKYITQYDLLHLRFDDRTMQTTCISLDDAINIDVADHHIVAIEILDAKKHIAISKLFNGELISLVQKIAEQATLNKAFTDDFTPDMLQTLQLNIQNEFTENKKQV